MAEPLPAFLGLTRLVTFTVENAKPEDRSIWLNAAVIKWIEPISEGRSTLIHLTGDEDPRTITVTESFTTVVNKLPNRL